MKLNWKPQRHKNSKAHRVCLPITTQPMCQTIWHQNTKGEKNCTFPNNGWTLCPVEWMDLVPYGMDGPCALWNGWTLCPVEWMDRVPCGMDGPCAIWNGWTLCPVEWMDLVPCGMDGPCALWNGRTLCPVEWMDLVPYGMDGPCALPYIIQADTCTYTWTKSLLAINGQPSFVKRSVWTGTFWAGFWTQPHWGDFADWNQWNKNKSKKTRLAKFETASLSKMAFFLNLFFIESKQKQ